MQGKPIPSHYRSRIIDLFSAGKTYSEIAADVRVDIKTVKNVVTRCINTGSHSPGKAPGRERYVCDQNKTRYIEYLKSARPSMTACEIQQELVAINACRIPPAESTINRVLRERLGYTYKKIQAIPRESEREDVKRKLIDFMEVMANTDTTTLHFLDESSVVRTSGNRLYGHSAHGKPAYEVQRYASNANFTVNLLHSIFGVDHFNILRGPSNQLELIHFIEQCLQQRDFYGNPKIKRGDTIVMDNCGMHHGRLATELLDDLANLYGFRVIYQPPYSPDFNTCEYCFRNMKCYLRQNTDFTELFTELAISFAIDTITPEFSVVFLVIAVTY